MFEMMRLNKIINAYAGISKDFVVLGRFLLLWAHKRGILVYNELAHD